MERSFFHRIWAPKLLGLGLFFFPLRGFVLFSLIFFAFSLCSAATALTPVQRQLALIHSPLPAAPESGAGVSVRSGWGRAPAGMQAGSRQPGRAPAAHRPGGSSSQPHRGGPRPSHTPSPPALRRPRGGGACERRLLHLRTEATG